MKFDFLAQIRDRLFSNTAFIPALGSLVLVLVLTVTLGLVSENQDNRQRAAEPSPTVSPLMSTQADTSGTGMKCEDYPGATCIKGDAWGSNKELCTGAYTIASGVVCLDGAGAVDATRVCCMEKAIDVDNNTCNGSCDFDSIQTCEANVGSGQCTPDPNGSCTNGKMCLTIPVASTPTTTPSVTPSSANCSIAQDGKEYCCPTGATRCGQTTDTMCPLCVPAGQTCATGSQYSEAMCTAAFGSGAGCDPNGDQAATDASCSSSTRGCTGAGQAFDKWACVANSSGSGGHCESQCKISPSIIP